MNRNINSLILILLVLVLLPAMAAETDKEKELGFWFEVQAMSGGRPSRLNGWYQHELTESLGFFAHISKESDGFRQFYFGPTWKPASWFQLGVGIGRETVPGEFAAARRGLFFDANWEKVNVFGTFENGRRIAVALF